MQLVHKSVEIMRRREKEFGKSLDNLFDIAHADAFQSIKIKDKVFLLRRRESGRVVYLGGIDKKLSEKEEKVLEKKEIEKRREKKRFLASTSSAVSYVSSSDKSIKEVFTSDENRNLQYLSTMRGFRDIPLSIATVYVIPWLNCSAAVKAPKQDLCVLKSLKSYERINETVSGAA
ncbi:hypothetical protein AVEN_215840-1 [Araneus ventricosus]|uniref:Uncharacterized protein n=1 Tax=Araneus ventricosus TaxID=182803 RepID=A0A4Y2VD14_ARAVE|nr:hypothetical protein AVEN_215840-1 [Araneus ventricosus]